MATTFAVIGGGAFGTAMAAVLARRADHRVRLWCARSVHADDIRGCRENRRYLPGATLPDGLTVTADIAAATAGADVWVSAVPTVHLRATIERFAVRPGDTPVVSLSKGVEVGTFQRPTEIWRTVLGAGRVAVLSGPSHAEEVVRDRPTSVVVAAPDGELAGRLQRWLNGPAFRVYTSDDMVGVELAGALKNVVGIAAGLCDGLGLGDNAKSALLTRALVEMARFGVALGAEAHTFYGLAGLGDLMTTCVSPHGRNRKVGDRLARGESLDTILASTPAVPEGVFTTRSVYERHRQMGLKMPILTEVYRVLYEAKSPTAAVVDLMEREPMPERV